MLQTASTSTSAAPRLGGWDLAGVVLSGICLVHCTLLPLALAMLPFLGLHFATDERVHVLVTLLVVPVALLALATGFWRHRRLWVPVLGAAGLAMILGGPVLHQSMGHLLEGVVTAVGGVALVCAHLGNRRALHANHGCC